MKKDPFMSKTNENAEKLEQEVNRLSGQLLIFSSIAISGGLIGWVVAYQVAGGWTVWNILTAMIFGLGIASGLLSQHIWKIIQRYGTSEVRLFFMN